MASLETKIRNLIEDHLGVEIPEEEYFTTALAAIDDVREGMEMRLNEIQ